jgi:uncharacterized phiE125 gp8 family phage protein
MSMPSFLLIAPEAEPLSLAEARNFLRVDINDDDDLISALVSSARIHVEAETRRALITQTWRLVRDAWPDEGRMPVLPAPLRAVSAARVYDAQNATHTVDPQSFVVDTAGAALTFASWALMTPGRPFAGIEIDVECGYGDTASDVPEPLRQAIRLLVAHWYENRAVVSGAQTAAALPITVAALIAPYRMLSL